MLEIKDTVTEMKNAFDGLISRMSTAKEGISEFEDIWIEATKTEKQRKKRLKYMKHNIQRNVEQLQKV